MSTPHQGPGRWKQGDERAALAWLANLDTRQQQALQRSIRTHQALGPIYNAVARGMQVARWTAARISEYAQRLASGARDLGQATSARANQVGQSTASRASEVREAVGQFGQNTAERAGQAKESLSSRVGELTDRTAEMVSRAREGVSNTVQATAATAQGAAQQAVAGLNTAREAVTDAGRQAVAAGQQAVAAGREAAGKASRWFNQQVSNGAMKASAAFAGIAARRHDPQLQGPDLKLQTNLELAQHFSQVAAAQTPEQLAAAEANLGKFIEAKRQQLESPAAGVKEAQNMAWVLQGSPSASEAVNQKPATGQQQPQQGEAAQPQQGTGKHRKQPGQEI